MIAESFERIHRSNLIGMGVLPLEFLPSQTRLTLGLDGREHYTIRGLVHIAPRSQVTVEARRADGDVLRFDALVRVDAAAELTYLRHGGILPMVLRRFIGWEAPV